MLSADVKEAIVTRINRLCGACTIYLFGSYAYGNPTSGSDIDIAVITEHVESNVAKDSELWDALSDMPMPKDIVVASRRHL